MGLYRLEGKKGGRERKSKNKMWNRIPSFEGHEKEDLREVP